MKIFSKLLTKNDVEKSLLIPTSSFYVLPFEEGHFFYLNVVDDKTGNVWTFPCYIQQISDDESKGSSVISIGWLKFASNKDLRVGDMVFLHQKSLDDNPTGSMTQFRIDVKRKIRLLVLLQASSISKKTVFLSWKLLIYSIGKAWIFLGSLHSNEEMGAFVYISLPQFVREKALKANNEIALIEQSLDDVNDKAPWKKFKIEVKRKIRLFGRDIWGNLMV
ncbi:hypothetical protein REPUB_Repub04eG0065700 [Reevesia pubescens]